MALLSTQQIPTRPFLWVASPAQPYQAPTNLYNMGGLLYQAYQQVSYNGGTYAAFGVAPPSQTLAPDQPNSGWTLVDAGAGGMTPLPLNNIYVGNASNQAVATPGNAYITGRLLNGYAIQTGTVSSSDTILSAIEKNAGNNAATNTIAVNAQTTANAAIPNSAIQAGTGSIVAGLAPNTPTQITITFPTAFATSLNWAMVSVMEATVGTPVASVPLTYKKISESLTGVVVEVENLSTTSTNAGTITVEVTAKGS